MTEKARKPGTSRRLCSTPISAPEKAARSMAKLLIKACQVAKLSGTEPAMRNSRVSGRRHPPDMKVLI